MGDQLRELSKALYVKDPNDLFRDVIPMPETATCQTSLKRFNPLLAYFYTRPAHSNLVVFTSREPRNVDIAPEAPRTLIIPNQLRNTGVDRGPMEPVFVTILIRVYAAGEIDTTDHRIGLLIPEVGEVLAGRIVAVSLVFEAGEVSAGVERCKFTRRGVSEVLKREDECGHSLR